MYRRMALAGCVMAALCGMLGANAETAALLRSGLPNADAPLENLLSAQLKAADYTVTELGFPELCDAARLSAEAVDVLVLPDSSALPAAAAGPIEAYLKAGGDIVALNAPMWRTPLIQDGAEWVTREAYREKHRGALMSRTLFDFAPGSIDAWHRNSNDLAHPAAYELQTGLGEPANNALHVSIGLLDNWETFVSPPLEQPFPEGQTLTVFWARGGPQTTELAVEWVEQDGSRWIGTAPLTGEWQLYVMEPKDFRYWESNPARANTIFQPEHAVKVSIGLALSHNRLSGDKHEYWLGPFGSAARTPEHEKLLTSFKAPLLDTLSPSYKFYECREVRKMTTGGTPIPVAGQVFAPHPRPGAYGFDKGRDWRWAPLVEAFSATGAWRGAPGVATVHAAGPWKGGVWVSFGVRDPAWYREQAVSGVLQNILQAMHYGVFLLDGGPAFYTYNEGQPITLGLRVVNVGKQERIGLSASVSLSRKRDDEFYPAGRKNFTFPLKPGEILRFAETFEAAQALDGMPTGEKTSPYLAAVSLQSNVEGVIDGQMGPVEVWRPKAQKAYITRKDGDLLLNGMRWRVHGVNYMPSSGIGTEDGKYFEQWLGARSYDPAVIQRDLERVKSMSLNAVSIFLYRESMDAQNLLDFLRRADALGLKVNLSLRPGSPMAEYDFVPIREMIESCRLAEHDCIFAYDLDWEPMFRDHDGRKVHDPAWRAWIVERYGSIENAEKDWGFAAPRDEKGEVTNPLGDQTVNDGDWRRMTAAYRRFLDTLLYEKYGEARRAVRELDPNHLVSFRMAEAGNPTFHWDKAMPYDFAYLGGAVDLLEPEAYGRIGDWEKVKPGRFEFEYARWAAPDRPMLWAEMGVSAWVESRMEAPADRLTFQADYYAHFYRMLYESGADGVFFWWYPGGFRVGENSDYGIIEPDGSDRPVTRVIREHARDIFAGADARPVNQWLEFDRDADPDGIGGIYDALKDAYWAGIAEGKTPGLKTAGTGTSSADCPLVAVGNTPCTGQNPPKYLDGFFDRVEVRNVAGQWVRVRRGDAVAVPHGEPTAVRLEVTNLGEARWLAEGQGAVRIVAQAGDSAVKQPLPKDAGKFETVLLDGMRVLESGPGAELEVVLTLESEGRVAFGPKFRFSVK